MKDQMLEWFFLNLRIIGGRALDRVFFWKVSPNGSLIFLCRRVFSSYPNSATSSVDSLFMVFYFFDMYLSSMLLDSGMSGNVFLSVWNCRGSMVGSRVCCSGYSVRLLICFSGISLKCGVFFWAESIPGRSVKLTFIVRYYLSSPKKFLGNLLFLPNNIFFLINLSAFWLASTYE